MFTGAIAYLEKYTPKWLKITIALVVFMWMAPIETRDWFYRTIDSRVHAYYLPIKVSRDFEIKELHNKIVTLNTKADETNAFVKAIALEQLGAKRYQQIDLTAVPKDK